MAAPLAQIRVKPDAMEEVARKIMAAGGCTEDEATATAEHLVGANLSGHDSHGIVRITRYHAWLRDGTLNPARPLRPIIDTPTLIQYDGQRGIGQYLCREATLTGMARAKDHGAAIVAMRRAGHIGRLGHYSEMAAEAGLASIQFCNVVNSRIVAPYGAAQRTMSTNPIAVGVPNPDGDPFILDFATAYVAEGKALVAASGGKPLPGDALVSAEGELTGDPAALYGETAHNAIPNPSMGPGALRTMGEHKGSGLALACDLLAGALTGNGTNEGDHPFGNGWLAIFIDPARLDDTAIFGTEVAAYINNVRSARPAQGIDKVRIPGDVERETRAERLVSGLPLAPRLLDNILSLTDELSLGVQRDDLVM